MKKIIKESELKEIISNMVEKVLKEDFFDNGAGNVPMVDPESEVGMKFKQIYALSNEILNYYKDTELDENSIEPYKLSETICKKIDELLTMPIHDI